MTAAPDDVATIRTAGLLNVNVSSVRQLPA